MESNNSIVGRLYRCHLLQNRLDEALDMHNKALAIRRKVLPEDHPDIAQSLNNKAQVLQDKVSEAVQIQK